MNYLSISKVIGMISKLEGSKGALSLGGKQLNMLAKDKKMAQVLSRMTDPQLDVAYKAKSNYNIAAFRLRDGKEVVANGAVSLQNPGTTESIIKYRLNVGENGNILRTNGFGDFGKQLDVDDVSVAISRQKGKFSTDIRSGKTAGVSTELDEQKAVGLISRYTGETEDNVRRGLYRGIADDANDIQKYWREAGNALSGAPKGPKAEKVAIPELKPFDPDLFKKGVPDEALTKLRKLAKEDFSEFVKVRKEMGKYGFQPYFHPKTGEFKIMDGVKNMEEVGKKLKAQGLINDIPKENFGKIKQPDIKNIDDYIKRNPSKLKEGEIESAKKTSLLIKEELSYMKSQFTKLTDEGEKAKLAKKYKDLTSKLECNEKYLASLMKELEN